MEIMNAVVRSTQLGCEDHGIFTAMISFDLGGRSVQGFLAYDLRCNDAAYKFIAGVLRVTGKGDWESLKGCVVRVKQVDGLLTEVGHYLNDDWFCPSVVLLRG